MSTQPCIASRMQVVYHLHDAAQPFGRTHPHGRVKLKLPHSFFARNALHGVLCATDTKNVTDDAGSFQINSAAEFLWGGDWTTLPFLSIL